MTLSFSTTKLKSASISGASLPVDTFYKITVKPNRKICISRAVC